MITVSFLITSIRIIPYPDDLELTADYLKRALERPEEMKYMFSDRKVPRLLRIFYISDLSGMVRERAEAQPQIGLLRNSAKLEYDGGGYVGEFVRALRKEKHRNGLFRTAVALKLYRSLHGAYPEHLDALVPGILPVLPADPMTGRPYEYRKDGDDFKLSYRVSPQGSNPASAAGPVIEAPAACSALPGPVALGPPGPERLRSGGCGE